MPQHYVQARSAHGRCHRPTSSQFERKFHILNICTVYRPELSSMANKSASEFSMKKVHILNICTDYRPEHCSTANENASEFSMKKVHILDICTDYRPEHCSTANKNASEFSISVEKSFWGAAGTDQTRYCTASDQASDPTNSIEIKWRLPDPTPLVSCSRHVLRL